MKNASLKNIAKFATAGAIGFGTMASAMADPFADAVTAISANVATYGAALVGVAAVGVVFSVAMKYVKRIPKAS